MLRFQQWRVLPALVLFGGLAGPGNAQLVSSYTISTFAGTGVSGFAGDDGAAVIAQLASPTGVTADAAGKVYICDTLNHRIRVVSATEAITTVGGTGELGYSGDDGKATSATIESCAGIAVDSSGTIYFTDNRYHVIRKIVSSGTISRIGGILNRGSGFSGDGGTATDAELSGPSGIVVDKSGNVYFSDTNNSRIRKVSASGIITTVAGGVTSGSSGDGGRATLAKLNLPRGLALDGLGNLYIADTGNNKIRKVSADGTITTIAGNGTAAYGGDGGPAVNASVRAPYGVAVDAAGVVYIAEYFSSRIRRVSVSGGISTIAGNGRYGYAGDGGPALSATLNFPFSLALGGSGTLYFTDIQNNVVRKLTPAGDAIPVPAIDKGGIVTAAAFGGARAAAPGSWIEIYGTNFSTVSRTWLGTDFNGVDGPTWLEGTSVTVGGRQAAISYVSPRQVNVQVPSGVPAGNQDVIVTSYAGSSAAEPLTIRDTEPGILSTAQFTVNGKAYAAALFTDYSYVAVPGSSPAIGARRAKPGDVILLYGVGFGSVTPDTPSGQLVQKSNTLTAPLQFFFGGVQATWSYAGLAGDAVGLYQFNVLVPSVPASDAVPLTFSLGGKPGSQPLFIAVQ
jgi:uncharacterized protein (TIGR03437 family)